MIKLFLASFEIKKNKLKKFYTTKKKYFYFTGVRLFSFFLIAFETFFGPKILGLDIYGEIEYEKQLINLSSIFLFGLHSGYSIMYYKYKEKKKLTSSYLIMGFLHIIVIFGIYSLISNTFSFGIVFFLLSILIEQILKIKNKFNLAVLFKPLFAVFLILYYSYYHVKNKNLLDFIFDVNLMYFFAFLFFILIVGNHLSSNIKKNQINFKNYFLYIKNGFQPNLSLTLVLLFFFIDRFLIEKYYINSLGFYSIAFNFSTISFLIASSIGYITTIKIGERTNDDESLTILVYRLIKFSYVYVFLILILFIPIIFYLNKVWFNIENFEEISIINLIGKTFFGAATFYTSVVYFRNKEHFSWILLLSIVILTLSADFFIISNYENGFVKIQYVSNFFMIIYCFLINYVVRKKALKTITKSSEL